MRAAESTTQVRLARLTRRERECLELVAQHWRTKDIARQLGLSPATVDEYVRSAVRKLGTPDRAAAARVWLGLEAAPGPAAEAEAEAADEVDSLGRSLRALLDAAIANACRWSLLTGGAVGGLVLLVRALAEADGVVETYSRLASGLGALFWLLIPLACILTYWIGGPAERVAAAVVLTSTALSMAAVDGSAGGAVAISIDLVTSGIFMAIAMVGRRPLLQLAAVAALLRMLTHPAFAESEGLSMVAYETVLGIWAHICVAAVVLSALIWRRNGREPARGAER